MAELTDETLQAMAADFRGGRCCADQDGLALLAEVERLRDEEALGGGCIEYHAEQADLMRRERDGAIEDIVVLKAERDQARDLAARVAEEAMRLREALGLIRGECLSRGSSTRPALLAVVTHCRDVAEDALSAEASS